MSRGDTRLRAASEPQDDLGRHDRAAASSLAPQSPLNMDAELKSMSKTELLAELKKLQMRTGQVIAALETVGQ